MSGTRKYAYKSRGSFGTRKKTVRKTPDYNRRRVGNATVAVRPMGIPRRPSLAETHYIDFNAVVDGACSTTWTTLPLTACPTQGSSAGSRYGNSITIRCIEITMLAKGVADSAADYYNDLRILFGFFKAPRGSGAPAASGVNGIMDNTTIPSPYSPMSQEFRSNWQLITDQKFALSTYSTAAAPYTTISSGADGRNFMHHRKFVWRSSRGVVCRTQANAGSAGDWETNIPFFVYGSDSSVVTHPTITVRTRMYFDP